MQASNLKVFTERYEEGAKIFLDGSHLVGLGPDFCQCGIDFDQRLAALGATPLAPRIDADVDIDEPFTSWETSVLSALATT